MNAIAELQDILRDRPCLVGTGNADRQDDAVGIRIVEEVRRLAGDALPTVNAEDVIENHVFAIAETDCRSIVIVDAVAADLEPGSVVFGPLEEFPEAGGMSSHKPSLAMCAKIFAGSGKRSYLLGVVPARLDFGRELSAEVAAAANQLIEIVVGTITGAHKEIPHDS
jgi:hydrogenase maturation protease